MSETAQPSETVPAEIEPRRGSLAWLQAQPHVQLLGLSLPACNRVQEGSTLRSREDAGIACRVVRPDGRPCAAAATKAYGVCIAHLGGGGGDEVLAAAQAKGAAKLARLKLTREVLGIGPNAHKSARGLARIAAAERAEEVAAALLGPLDDRKLGAMEKQRAAQVILGETEPLSTATVEVSLPTEPSEVEGMGWADMRALAARLAGPDS